ncbi:hypothetical protein GQ44DRAFT_762948 [Phaeosphaeriaceae sp. PMI808]|nr:hypothetical protein GQ44DRAFT_762948 [Phaeosphaeriaceae sp. PMI808]
MFAPPKVQLDLHSNLPMSSRPSIHPAIQSSTNQVQDRAYDYHTAAATALSLSGIYDALREGKDLTRLRVATSTLQHVYPISSCNRVLTTDQVRPWYLAHALQLDQSHCRRTESMGGPDSSDKRDWLAGQISQLFADESSTDTEDVEVMLLQVLEDEFGVRLEDETEVGVAREIMLLRKEIGEGKTDTVDRLQKKWDARQGKEIDTGSVSVKESDQDAEWDSVDEESGEEDQDVGMAEAPSLAPARARVEAEVDEEGFTRLGVELDQVQWDKPVCLLPIHIVAIAMDSAYDHIQEESYPQDPTKQQTAGDSTHEQTASNFNAEIQDAYNAISSSPWAARLGGFFGTGEQYYDSASKQYAETSKSATASVSTLIGHARNLSVQANDASTPDPNQTQSSDKSKDDPDAHPDRPDSLPADIVREAGSVLLRFRSEAAKRFKDIEKAEDAADEALLKFGTNIRNFLADAVSIAPPASGSEDEKNGTVLFESKDSSGKKVVHATRFDAQLHVIHSTLASFLNDPVSPEWEKWRSGFVVEDKTDAIAKDLDKHAELRTAMEKCVPEQVQYAVFWERYYFLRHVIESEEQRRREMLKASAPTAEEEVAWDEDSEDSEEDDDDEEESSDEESSDDEEPSSAPSAAQQPTNKSATNLAASRETLKPVTESLPNSTKEDQLKPTQPRRSNDEKSVADSDASYDVVSGATSRAPGSPQQEKKKVEAEESDEESEEEDWE